MKKIMGLFVLMLSLVLMPSSVKADSYKDYFTIGGYVKNEFWRDIKLIFTDYKDKVVTDDNGITEQVTGSFLIETEEGKYDEYANGKFAIGLGDETFMLYYLNDEGLNSEV